MLTFFADTCFLVGRKCPGDQYHDRSEAIWNKLIDLNLIRGLEDIYITDYVLVESFLQIQNNEGYDCAVAFWNEMLNNSNVKWTTRVVIEKAIIEKMHRFRNHSNGQPSIGLVDAITLKFMDSTNIRRLISYDAGFGRYPLIRILRDEKTVMEFAQRLYTPSINP